MSYSLGRPAAPVALESSSLAPDRMLLLDTYQQIILLSGAGRTLLECRMGRQRTATGNAICAGVAQWLKAAKDSPADASSPAAGAASGLIKMQVDLTETKVDLTVERGRRSPRSRRCRCTTRRDLDCISVRSRRRRLATTRRPSLPSASRRRSILNVHSTAPLLGARSVWHPLTPELHPV